MTFKRPFFVLAAAVATLSQAFAADVLPAVVKAKAVSFVGNPCTPVTCTGFYVGGGLGGVGTNIDVIGNGLNGSVGAGGMLPTLKFGYLYAQNNWLFGIEAAFAYQTNSKVTVGDASGSQAGMLMTQGVKFGGNIATLLGTTAIAPITIPPSLAAAVINPYLQAGAAEHQVVGGGLASGAYSGAGVLFETGAHSFVDIDYKNIQYGATKSGLAAFNQENVITASWNYKF